MGAGGGCPPYFSLFVVLDWGVVCVASLFSLWERKTTRAPVGRSGGGFSAGEPRSPAGLSLSDLSPSPYREASRVFGRKSLWEAAGNGQQATVGRGVWEWKWLGEFGMRSAEWVGEGNHGGAEDAETARRGERESRGGMRSASRRSGEENRRKAT